MGGRILSSGLPSTWLIQLRKTTSKHMKILAHIHTLNDEEVIEQSFAAVSNQTHPVQEILVVDNGSTDDTLRKLASKPVTVIRHSKNLGTSGAVVTGMQYAIDHGYDWIWIFDADGAPRQDSLAKLLELYHSLAPEVQEQVWLLSSLHVEDGVRTPYYQAVWGHKGLQVVRPDPKEEVCEFDSTIWSGSMYKVSAIEKVGLPSVDYVLDWGEHTYGYRGRRSGYRALMPLRSLVDHNIGGTPGLHHDTFRLGPFSFRAREFPPIRCYYFARNLLNFWLYEYHELNWSGLLTSFLRIFKLTVSFLPRLGTHRAQFVACLRGIRDGFGGKMHRRY